MSLFEAGPHGEWKSVAVCAADLVESGFSGLGADVDHVDPRGDEGGEDEAVPLLGRIAEAAAAGVPATVVELVVDVGHRKAVDDLQNKLNRLDRLDCSRLATFWGMFQLANFLCMWTDKEYTSHL